MSRPTATVTVLPPVSPDPTRKRVRITVSPAGQYLVRGWFTKSASPTGTTAAIGPASPGDAFFAATDALGIRDVEVSQEQAAYFYCNVAVLGLVASSGNTAGLQVLPASWAFGAVELGSYEDKVFTVSNSGGIGFSGVASAAAPFSIVGTAAYTLAPAEAASITVRFTPASGTPVSGTVAFTGGGGLSRVVTGTGFTASAGEYAMYAPADALLTTEGEFAAWANALTTGKTASPVQGAQYTLSVAPPPSVTNLVIAYPASIRLLNSVVQTGTGAQVRLSWVNGTYSTFAYGGVTYRVYQNVTLFPWTEPEEFIITL